jgi:hypothetical protein
MAAADRSAGGDKLDDPAPRHAHHDRICSAIGA